MKRLERQNYMMKKKLALTTALAVAVTSILVVGGSLAYFTDTDSKENVFTVGDVDIRLDEEFIPDSKLYPGEEKDAVKKEVDVTNTGSEDAFVRVHIAVPAELDNNGYLHLVKGGDEWSWADQAYTSTIGNLNYNVYVATYPEGLAPEDTTVSDAITGVYMDAKVTNEIIEELKNKGIILTGSGSDTAKRLNIQVMAEGVQTAGFESADAAFAAALPYSGASNPFNQYAQNP